ncbi:MAG: hypothetical protein QG567_249 [Campylobacterota bacterium]|nr:hypothetical protein [Campylobacterota bacterium]
MKRFEEFLYSVLSSKTKKLLVLFITFLAFLGSVMLLPTEIVLAKMLPGKSANSFSVYVDAPSGSSACQTKEITDCVVGVLQKEKEITDIEVFLGMGSPLDYAGLVKGSGMKRAENLAEIVVNLTDKHHRSEESFLMVQRLRPVLQSACEPIKEGTNIKMIEQPAGPPTLASIVIELYGENSQRLREVSTKISDILKKTDGLVDVDVMQDEIYKKYELVINKEKIIKADISIKQLNQILYLAFEGMEVAVKNSENSPEQIPLFLILSKETKTLNDFSKESLIKKLSSLNLMSQSGAMVAVSELVEIKEVDSNPTIMTKNLKNMVNIIAETDMVSQVYPLLDARTMIKEELSDEFEIESTYLFDYKLTDKKTGEVYELVWDGEMKVTMDTFIDLGAAFVAALVLIFLLLVIYYKSFAISGIVLLGSFLSIIGVIVGHWVMDIFTEQTFFLTATSLIGFIALMGISSRNSLLLIDFARQLMKEKNMPKQRAIAVASATRAKPIFLTAAAIILASTLLAADPVFGGLGVALIFGTIAAVAVSLIFIPVLMHNSKAIDVK